MEAMEAMEAIFASHKGFYEQLITPAFIGFLTGVMKELSNPKKILNTWIKTIVNSAFLCCVIFLFLDMFEELSYNAKIGIAAISSFLGLEKCVSHIKELISIFRR